MSYNPAPEATDYYNLDQAKAFMATSVPPGCRRWVCVLCMYPQGDYPDAQEIGAYACGACGMTCVRPWNEVKKAQINEAKGLGE